MSSTLCEDQRMSENKEKILAAASELFLDRGLPALSVRAIAARAGVSTMGIYSHFDGKQGILDALYMQGFAAVSEAMDVRELGLTPVDAALQAAQNYLDLAAERPAHYHLIFAAMDEDYAPGDEARQAGARAFNANVRLMGDLLGEASTRKEQQHAAMQVWSLLHGAVALEHHAVAELVDLSSWREEALEAVKMLLAGITQERS